jgi:hypothetical protein
MMSPATLRRAAAPALLCAVVACGAAQPAPVTPAAAAPSASAAPVTAPDAYSPYADPSFLTLQNEKNVYVRHTLALLWVASVKGDPPGAARDARQKQATQALSDAEAAVAAQGDPCKGGVLAALQRATADKGQLERRYLAVSETEGENSEAAKAIDEQVHVLRDAMDELGVLAKPCPAQMFPDSDYEPR